MVNGLQTIPSTTVSQTPVSNLGILVMLEYLGLHFVLVAAFEACTYMNTNNLVPVGNGCRFWTNGQGGIHYGGKCNSFVLD